MVSFVLFWCFEKHPTFISNLKDVTRWLLQDKSRFPSLEVLFDFGGDSVHLHIFLVELEFHFCLNFSSQLQNT